MSTRGTYTFRKEGGDTEKTYYIHHDNYPSGVVDKFKCLEKNPEQSSREDIEIKFIKNHPISPSGGVFWHGDTEYHYSLYEYKNGDIDVDAFEIRRKETCDSNGENYRLLSNLCQFFTGSIEEFIRKYKE